MNCAGKDQGSPQHSAGRFQTTQWSLVVAAGQAQDSERQRALAGLCARYWRPLYAYARRRGSSVEEAQDFTQEFFCRVLEKNRLSGVRRERGRFRNFLLAAFKNFLTNEWDRATAQRRGGGAPTLSLDFALVESGIDWEPSHSLTPEKLYERNWALAVLELSLERLKREYADAGKAPLFETLKACLAATQPQEPLAELGARLGMTEGAVKVAVHRLRQRYRAALRREIAETVADSAEVEDEIGALFSALEG